MELAKRTGGRRYKRFLELLGERLQAGKSLTEDLPNDVFFKADDFPSEAAGRRKPEGAHT
jgi:hypothetical protein